MNNLLTKTINLDKSFKYSTYDTIKENLHLFGIDPNQLAEGEEGEEGEDGEGQEEQEECEIVDVDENDEDLD